MNNFKLSIAPTLFAAAAASIASSATAGSATVSLGSEEFTLNEVTCEGGPESFRVQASVNSGPKLLQLGAFKGEVQSVGFRAGDMMAQVADQTGAFDGSTFRFEGEAQVYTLNAINRKKLSIVATCD